MTGKVIFKTPAAKIKGQSVYALTIDNKKDRQFRMQ